MSETPVKRQFTAIMQDVDASMHKKRSAESRKTEAENDTSAASKELDELADEMVDWASRLEWDIRNRFVYRLAQKFSKESGIDTLKKRIDELEKEAG